ncbi:MAG: mannitol dehydrogenase family protein [Bacillota bacterium]|nr:mannitol dehydrogenase family protein [Bacillota bacterium]
MRLSADGIKDRKPWEAAGIRLPEYDVEKASLQGVKTPRWVHFGIGNIFRVFLGGIADDLITNGAMDEGLTCVEAYDDEIIDRIYAPHDNLALSVILHSSGKRDYRVLGAFAEAVKVNPDEKEHWERLKTIFRAPSLQIVSFTVTEKAYALSGAEGGFSPVVEKDIENGPDRPQSLIAILASLLLERFRDGEWPISLVSMDNCAHNGLLLKNAVLTIAGEWKKKGFVEEDFIAYLNNDSKAAFPCTMIDKITPRPAQSIADDLSALGVEGMQPIVTSAKTYIAPFVNAESPQYLVIEDAFPNGRPDLSKCKGVYLTDRATVDLAERMKVTACLNPVHTATGPLGVVLGHETFAGMLLQEPMMLNFAKSVAYDEGIPMIQDPVIISPMAFTDELFSERFPNIYLGDTNLRLSTDVSQGLGVRFGETIKAYLARYGSAERLTAIPLGIAGWFRYLLGIDDMGKRYELAPDPLEQEIHQALSGIVIGQKDSFKDQLRPYLSDERIFHTNLYHAGLGQIIEGMFAEMIQGPGAVREAIRKRFGPLPG